MSEELNPPRFPTMLRKMWSGSEVQAWIDENWNRRAQPAAPADAAPSVAPEPVAWTTLIEIDWVKRNAGRAGSFYAVKAGPNDIPLFAHPPRAPLTDEHVYAVVRSVQPHLATTSKAWRELAEDCRYWLKAERAVTEAAHGIRGQG